MFEDKCHERGVACKRCSAALGRCADFEDVVREAGRAGVDKRFMVSVRAMWTLARRRAKARSLKATSATTRTATATAGSSALPKGTRVPRSDARRFAPSAVDGGNGVDDDDGARLSEIARLYGVDPDGDRASVVRRCLLKCHPDKRRACCTAEDRANFAFLMRLRR